MKCESNILNRQKIVELLGTEELLCQLAEECVELAQAVDILQQLRNYDLRKIRVENDFTKQLAESKAECEEEFADVELVIAMVMASIGITATETDFINRIANSERTARKDKLNEANIVDLRMNCLKVSKNALKLRRALTKKNPTPISFESARMDLIYNAAILQGNMTFLTEYFGFENIYDVQEMKTKRWIGRLQGSDVNEQE